MLIVPFVNPFSQKEESIERGGEGGGERSWPQLLERGGEGRLAGQVVPSPYPTGTLHFEWRRRKGEGRRRRWTA